MFVCKHKIIKKSEIAHIFFIKKHILSIKITSSLSNEEIPCQLISIDQ